MASRHNKKERNDLLIYRMACGDADTPEKKSLLAAWWADRGNYPTNGGALAQEMKGMPRSTLATLNTRPSKKGVRTMPKWNKKHVGSL